MIVVPAPNQPQLILASGSVYRAELLARLHLPFTQLSPNVDESANPDEAAADLANRLALSKARAVVAQQATAWVIGSDQVAACAGRLLGKPGSREKAIEQLRFLSGQTAQFHTAVVVLHQHLGCYGALDTTTVRFRTLGDDEITRYVDSEPAYDCAGAAKIEGLGITLTDEVLSTDPTALIGLPLIATARLLRQAGYVTP
jgi:septum formation protein